ncbi:hypothetical protein I4F81_004128 [Pyropia yezoensis]|uniref:Uncharacterized protein n=1 Tax=Pyropia yezoensis TaxID=2788 RepID=A0ACC3BU23_PYRYE|nr:hypothetical protein I4F81_004128 [Neopyropia yezoensis]
MLVTPLVQAGGYALRLVRVHQLPAPATSAYTVLHGTAPRLSTPPPRLYTSCPHRCPCTPPPLPLCTLHRTRHGSRRSPLSHRLCGYRRRRRPPPRQRGPPPPHGAAAAAPPPAMVAASSVTSIVPATPPPATPPPAVAAVAAKLQTELPALFRADADPDWSLYTPNVRFEDPLNRFRGVAKYRDNIRFLKESFAFRDAAMYLHDTVAGEDAVVTRWTLAMTAAFLPWSPRVVFTGESVYGVDLAAGETQGGVNRHIDTWDSIAAQGFPSVEAVADLVRQLSPAGAAVARAGSGGDPPPGVPPYLTLRREAAWEVRRVDGYTAIAATDGGGWGGEGGVDARAAAAVRAAWAAAVADAAAAASSSSSSSSSRVPLLVEVAPTGRGVVTAALPAGVAAPTAGGAARVVAPRTVAVAAVGGPPKAAAVAAARDGLVARLGAAGVTPVAPDAVTVVVVPGLFGTPLLRRTEVWIEVAA